MRQDGLSIQIACPGASLDRWWPAARCQQMGAFAEPGEDNVTVLAYRPRVRPDGHGIFTHGLRRVSFFLEFDNNTMQLARLVEKVTAYEDLARVYDRVWPVLFSLHSAHASGTSTGSCPRRASGAPWPPPPATGPA